MFIGAVVLIVTSSVVHYANLRSNPELARFVNKHAWIAIGINCAANLAFMLFVRR